MKEKFSDSGFTLIELMIVIAMLSITLGWLVHAQISSHQLAESEIGLQRAVRALQNQVEILRVLPYEELKPGTSIPFDPRVKELEQLVDARGIVQIKSDPEYQELLQLSAEVHWRDARIGMRSVHTVLLLQKNTFCDSLWLKKRKKG